jgi:hypothetical protein
VVFAATLISVSMVRFCVKTVGSNLNRSEQSRAETGRGAALQQKVYAFYASQVAVKFDLRSSTNQIAVPWGGPAMRGGLRP